MKRLTLSFSLAAVCFSFPLLSATEMDAHWPRWRGPNADGTAANANPPLEWSQEKNIRWKVPVPGKGSASPVIWGDRIFLLTAIRTDRAKEGESGSEAEPEARAGRRESNRRGRRRGGRGGAPPSDYYQFAIICYDRTSGKELWRKVAAEEVPHEAGHGTNTFASSSPVTDGKHIYIHFGSRGVFCYDMQGNRTWQRDLGRMQTRAGFGEGSSPALHGDTLVVPWDHEGQSFVAALDAKTGDVRWKAERDERTTWATPLIVEYKGRTQVITNGNRVRSYDLATGELIWECGGQVDNPIPSPVRYGDVVYCMTGYRGNAIYAIPLDAKGDITDSEKIVWHRKDAAPYVSSPVLYKGRLYFTKSRGNVLLSVDAKTGETVIDEHRLEELDSAVYASPVAASDRIYLTGRNGTTVVIRHGSKVEVLATNELGEGIDASPALVGEELYLRGESHLYCIARS